MCKSLRARLPYVRDALGDRKGHAWLWAVRAHPRLGAILARGVVEVEPPATWTEWLREAARAPRLDVLPLTVEIAIESERIPEPFPRDPADRLIAATARVHDLTLLTADRAMRTSRGLRTAW